MSESAGRHRADLRRPVLLTDSHHTASFDCGKHRLNDFLVRHALENQKGGKSRTYVALRAGAVVAFYSLAPGSVGRGEAPDRIARGQGSQDIPVILLARLAVTLEEQGVGLGRFMLLEALRRSIEGADVIGGRAVLVHAEDEQARGFYLHHGFEPSPSDDLHLLLLMKDLRKTLRL
jgi:GNAT superfamily N-acetyltransferase